MTTVYFTTKHADRDQVLTLDHHPLISLQITEPIKRSKEPIPADLLFFKLQGASYDVFRALYDLGKKKAKINFLY